MRNTILKNLAVAGVVLMLAAASIQAQTPTKIQVQIPFDFAAGTSQFKAGAYVVKRISDRTLALRTVDGKKTALLNAPLSLHETNSNTGERIVFNKYGDQYFLAQVWLQADEGRQLLKSPAEIKVGRELRLEKNYAGPERVAIALHK
jgi:hypothetical protein